MAAGTTISKSVARSFQLLELFRDEQEPLTAADVQHALDMPQPSTRALLKNLVAIGYLDYDSIEKTYFPNLRLATLGNWLEQRVAGSRALRATIDAIALDTGETTSLCTARDGDVEILYVRKAEHPVALQLAAGVAARLWETAVGRTVLATMSDEAIAPILAGLPRRGGPSRANLERQIRGIRRRGHFIAYDLFLEGVGAICVPVPDAGPKSPLVIAVAGLKQRIRPKESVILRAIRRQLRRT